MKETISRSILVLFSDTTGSFTVWLKTRFIFLRIYSSLNIKVSFLTQRTFSFLQAEQKAISEQSWTQWSWGHHSATVQQNWQRHWDTTRQRTRHKEEGLTPEQPCRDTTSRAIVCDYNRVIMHIIHTQTTYLLVIHCVISLSFIFILSRVQVSLNFTNM